MFHTDPKVVRENIGNAEIGLDIYHAVARVDYAVDKAQKAEAPKWGMD
jgi:hypothetical protein